MAAQDYILQEAFTLFNKSTNNDYLTFFLEGYNPTTKEPSKITLTDLYSGIPASAIITEMLNDNAVTESKIATSAVTTSRIANGAITNSKLANNSVTAEKIPSGTIKGTHINASEFHAGDFISDDELKSRHLSKISGQEAVSTDTIQDGAVTTPKLANSAVTKDKINFSTFDLTLLTAARLVPGPFLLQVTGISSGLNGHVYVFLREGSTTYTSATTLEQLLTSITGSTANLLGMGYLSMGNKVSQLSRDGGFQMVVPTLRPITDFTIEVLFINDDNNDSNFTYKSHSFGGAQLIAHNRKGMQSDNHQVDYWVGRFSSPTYIGNNYVMKLVLE